MATKNARKVPVLTRRLFLTSTGLAAAACRTHVDCLTPFAVEGQMLDAGTRSPLEGVTVTFVDTGLDPRRSRYRSGKVIGQSDAQGNIDLRFGYLWECDASGRPKTAGTVGVTLSKDGYEDRSKSFAVFGLPESGGRRLLALGLIYLEPKRRP